MHSHRQTFQGADGLTLVADVSGPAGGRPVVLMHGGGQTRGSWKNGARALAAHGWRVFSLDARGHGESSWAPDGDYGLPALVADLRALAPQLPPAPALVGASMGGMTALAALGAGAVPGARALVLVDVTPRLNRSGTERIVAFMRSRPDGFASVEEAADAVAAYNPNRPRPRDPAGLKRNLRLVNGRWHWHWDPAFVGVGRLDPQTHQAMLDDAARRVTVPTLLVRGTHSDIVGEDEVEHFRALMPQAGYVDVSGAGHMIAGDRNDAFNDAIVGFLRRIDAAA